MLSSTKKEDHQLVGADITTTTTTTKHSHISHVRNNRQQCFASSLPMSNYDLAELKWKNGHLAMHDLGRIVPSTITKGTPTANTWFSVGGDDNTLESIVHQATTSLKQTNQNSGNIQIQLENNLSSTSAVSSSAKWGETSAYIDINPTFTSKRMRCDQSNRYLQENTFAKIQEDCVNFSTCGSASVTFSQDNDITLMTWPSFESPPSNKKITMTTNDDYPSLCHGSKEKGDAAEEWKNKEETSRSHSTRRSRSAAIHNQSERKRRHKINQKMKSLQKMVPNASKTDKASMLDEVIVYIKQLQSQLQVMNIARNMPQMMMMMQQQHQQLQMSTMLARMRMGMDMGMNMNMNMNMNIGSTTSPHQFIHPSSSTTFMPSPFIGPPLMQKQEPSLPNHTQPAPDLFNNNQYYALLAQSMSNIEMYNKMHGSNLQGNK